MSEPKFIDGDLVGSNKALHYGYIQAWENDPEHGSIYQVFNGKETSWQKESELRPVTMLFCPANLKWIIG